MELLKMTPALDELVARRASTRELKTPPPPAASTA
jgi:hypothetical protein